MAASRRGRPLKPDKRALIREIHYGRPWSKRENFDQLDRIQRSYVQQLVKKGYVTIYATDDDKLFELTDKGKRELTNIEQYEGV